MFKDIVRSRLSSRTFDLGRVRPTSLKLLLDLSEFELGLHLEACHLMLQDWSG